MKKLLMEFVGTFFFILSIALTGNSIAIASMLMAWVYIGSLISGSHYNPMVSVAVALRGRMEWSEVPGYIIAQILGGFAAFAFTHFIHGTIAIPHPGAEVTLLQAFIVEVLLAFVLALVILIVATNESFEGNDIFGLAIGFTIPALAAVGGPISGGLFNPAIAIGAAAFGYIKGMAVSQSHLAMYVGGAFLGGALAAYLYNYLFDYIIEVE